MRRVSDTLPEAAFTVSVIFQSSLLAYPKVKPQKESLQSGGRQRTYYLFEKQQASNKSTTQCDQLNLIWIWAISGYL